MSSKTTKYTFTAYNIIGLASQIGGLLKIILIGFGSIALQVNERVIKAKLMRSLFFIEKAKEKRRVFNIPLGDNQKQTNNLLTIRS